MRPTPIPDNEIWEGAERHVISPPGGDLTDPDIAPVEALVDVSPSTGVVNLSVRCVLEDDDLDKLRAGGTIWLTFWGSMVPWAATVVPPVPDSTTAAAETQPSVHAWPDDDRHMWGPWLAERGLPKPTQYRICVHPLCRAVDHRGAPRA